MFRKPLCLMLLAVTGAGCSATRPLWRTVTVTPPQASPVTIADAEPWRIAAVAVTYPSATSAPPPCAPVPVQPVESMTFFEDDEQTITQLPAEPTPVEVMVAPIPATDPPEAVPSTSVTTMATPATVHAASPTAVPSVPASVPVLAPANTEFTPPVPVTSAAPAVSPTPAILPTPTQSAEVQAPGIAYVNPDNSSIVHCQPVIRAVEPHVEARAEKAASPFTAQADISELLTEIRNQRKLIEALQRDLMRERYADDAAIDELEAAVENLLVQTQPSSQASTTTIQK